MREGEAFSLLTKGVPGLGTGQVRQVAGHLGEWPLPLQLAAAVMRERVLQGESTTHAGEQLLKIIERKGVRALEDPSAERHHRNNGLGRGFDTGGLRLSSHVLANPSQLASHLRAAGRRMRRIQFLGRTSIAIERRAIGAKCKLSEQTYDVIIGTIHQSATKRWKQARRFSIRFAQHCREFVSLERNSVRMVRVTRDEAQSQD
jgi:hypothetical protein